MNILKAIKAWWKPEVKEASTKATVRFKNGVAFSVKIPANAGFDMRNKVDGFQYRNQDWKAVEEMRIALHNMGRQQAMGMEARGFGGHHGLAAQQSHFANRLLSPREMGRLI